MQPFWDVLWSDTKGLALFVAPMLALSVPASAMAAVFGAVNLGLGSWRKVAMAVVRGIVIGTIVALILSMLIELSLKAEGLSDGRSAMRVAANWQLCLAAPLVAVLAAFFSARYYAPPAGDPRERRRYTIRQLLIGQLIAGLLLGWWAYTRRDEIGQRRQQIKWQVRDRQMKEIYEPYGWAVSMWPNYEDVVLVTPRSALNFQPPSQIQSDEALRPVAVYGPVTDLYAISDAITDDGLQHLEKAERLRRLSIASRQITDDGIARLCVLPRLRYLTIRSPNVTDQSLAQLAKVKSLRFLELQDTKITPAAIDEFRRQRPGVDVRVSP
jgi:hypothetical protein